MTKSRRGNANALSVLAQMACLDIPGDALLDELLTALQDVVAFDRTSYMGYNAQGGVSELRLDAAAVPAMVALYLQEWMGKLENESFAPHLRERLARRDYDCIRMSGAVPRLRHSAYHDQILRSQGIADEARVMLCRDGHPGAIGLARDRRDFTDADLSQLRQAMPYLAQAMARQAGPSDLEGSYAGDSALLLVNRMGRIEAGSRTAYSLLTRAAGRMHVANSTDVVTLAWAQPYLSAIVQRVEALLLRQPSELPAVVERNRYGTFHLRGYVLRQAMAGMPPLYGIQIERRMSLEQRLFASERFRRLTASEREVALRLARGATPAGIALELGVKTSTPIFHMRNIYRRLGIHQRSDLVRALISDVSR